MYMARIQSHPGDIALLPVHATVLVTFGLGIPYILGIVPDAGRNDSQVEPESLTGTSGHGGEDPILSRTATSGSRAANEPRDMIPGDAVLRGPDGAAVSALGGRVGQLKGSDLAKIETFGSSDLVRIVAGIMQVITWMGESRVVNNEGKTSYLWDGGSDQLTQTGPDEAQYTIHLQLGHVGNLARFEITTREGQPKFTAHVGPDGRLRIFGAESSTIHLGGEDQDTHRSTYVGSVTREVTGSEADSVEGDSVKTVNGTLTTTVEQNHNSYVHGTQLCQVLLDRRATVSGNEEQLVQGNREVFVQGRSSHEVLGGEIYDVKTSGGAIDFHSRGGLCRFRTGTGNFEVECGGTIKLLAGADQIELGRGATSHATKFEELNAAIQSLAARLNAVHALLVAHVHPLSGPIPGNSGPSPSLVPIPSEPIVVNLLPAKSDTTKVK